ncbi:MAG: hypothetical protein GTO71_04255 [Woeseiaceae bacterium]|nr:hypothetical protein [Woeseiaceae bacterium]NIP20312.1 hypothetical protein [Woeseiaceae bacterium]NIS89129.1 hypothetical protein [Woeseiaceae bacterium]
MNGENMPFGFDGMETGWLAKLSAFGTATIDAFLWPGTFVTTRLAELAPALATKLGIGVDGTGVLLALAISLLAWALVMFLVWKIIKSVGLYIYYNVLWIKTFIVSTFRRNKARAVVEAATEALKKSEVVFDDLDVAVLNTGVALAPGLALSAPQLSDHLTKRPALIERSLEKLKKYGLLAIASGDTEGYDNYQLTPSGAALVSMWESQGEPAETSAVA